MYGDTRTDLRMAVGHVLVVVKGQLPAKVYWTEDRLEDMVEEMFEDRRRT